MTSPATAAPTRPGQPARDPSLLPGAEGWSNVYYDETGNRRTSGRRVQIDQFGQLVASEWSCPKCHATRLSPVSTKKIPVCVVDGAQLQQGKLKRPPLLPWTAVWRATEKPLRPVAPYVAAVVLAEAVDVPLWAWGSATVAAALTARAVAMRVLVRQATSRGRLDETDPDAGKGYRETLARRARAVGYGVLAGGTWTTAAAETGLDPTTAGGCAAWLSLPLVAAATSVPWWLWLAKQRRPATVLPGRSTPDAAVVDIVDPFELDVKTTWATRVGAASGALPNTKLSGFKYVKGGWSATVTSDHPGSIEPDRWRNATGRVAAAYRCGLTDVSLELDGGDASQATVLVQRENPLCEVVMWPGPAETWDFDRGVSMVGRFGDNEPARYRWWNEGGPWHDLISGATGSGKSEFVNQLLLSELHSGGRILSRVIDPQWGQSFGDLQDHVDWFAPEITEARYLLLDTVKQMRRRNRLYSRLRQKCWTPGSDEPLIVVTIDEAHEVLKDPICLELVERLAKMARKCGIKLRIITQVPVVTEIGNSTPIKDALLGGNIVVFRTGSAISSQVSIGATLPVDPHRLPPEWPKGSPGEGKTTAGLGFMAGASRREVPWRSFYNGAGLGRWLYDDGGPITCPGVPSAAMVAESSVLWSDRRERVRLLFEQPPDDGDILPAGLVDALIASARAGTAGQRRADMPQVAPVEAPPEDRSARSEVLRLAVRLADAGNRVEKSTIAEHARGGDGEPMKPGTLTSVLTKLVADRTLLRVKNGLYEVTDKARNEVGAEAEAQVDAMIGPDDVDGDV